MSIMQTRKMKKQQAEDTLRDIRIESRREEIYDISASLAAEASRTRETGTVHRSTVASMQSREESVDNYVKKSPNYNLFYTHREEIVKKLTLKLKKHHGVYTIPCRAEQFEDLFVQCLKEVTPNADVLWKPGSHSPGADIVWDGIRIQNKSGDFNLKKGTVKFNGSRTSSYETIEDKIAFLSEDKIDYYVLLGREKNFDCDAPRYFLMWFESKKIDYKNAPWEEYKGGWRSVAKNYEFRIVKSLSHQLWTTANIEYLQEFKHEIKL